jgi:hypothetical protein
MKNNDISICLVHISTFLDILSWLTETSITQVDVYDKKDHGNALRYAVLDFYMRY